MMGQHSQKYLKFFLDICLQAFIISIKQQPSLRLLFNNIKFMFHAFIPCLHILQPPWGTEFCWFCLFLFCSEPRLSILWRFFFSLFPSSSKKKEISPPLPSIAVFLLLNFPTRRLPQLRHHEQMDVLHLCCPLHFSFSSPVLVSSQECWEGELVDS